MSVLPKAAFIDDNPPAIFRAFDEKTIASLKEIVDISDRVYTRDDLSELADVEYLFSTWGMLTLNEEEIARYLPKAKAVFYAAGSVQHFARPFLNRGIAVHSAWSANGVPVAEVAYSEIMLANKGFFQCPRKFREQGKPVAAAYHLAFPGNYNVCVGILGAGMIGSMVAKKLSANDVRVKVFDPFASDEHIAEIGAERASLDEIFSTCQTISCHIANNERTKGMLTYELFSKMLPNATFINTGRGAQLIEADLVRALTECPDRTAVLDVTFPEPPQEGHPFYSLPNVYLTPHLAGSSANEIARMGAYMYSECAAYLKGEPTKWGVTLKMLETLA